MSGAMKMSRTVPDATNDAVAKLSMAFRVTDAGELEVVAYKAPDTFVDGEYVEGESETYRSSLDGATNVVPPSGCPPLSHATRSVRACLASWRRSRTRRRRPLS
jgi:hypothetical protein